MGRSTLLPRIAVSALLSLSLLTGSSLFAADLEYAPPPPGVTGGCLDKNTAVTDYFRLVRATRETQPEAAEALRLFPKGADLHNHLSGSVTPEEYLALAQAEGDCYGPDRASPDKLTLAPPTPAGACIEGFRPVAGAGEEDLLKVLRSLSMLQFDYRTIQEGHDQFFASFGRFKAVSGDTCNAGAMLAALLRQANRDNVSYVEVMASFQSQAVDTLANLLRRKYPESAFYERRENYAILYDYLLEVGLNDAVSAARDDVSRYLARKNVILGCASAKKDPACGVGNSFLASINRNPALKDGSADLAKVFTQTAFSILLAATDSRVAGVNLVSGEDAPVSMGSFATEMGFFAFFHGKFPEVDIALHAGEITPCFAGAGNPALKEHLTGSLQAGARRIGHGVSFAYLSDGEKEEVAQLFMEKGALVEIMFTSNAQILGVTGAGHPFMAYRRFGVPIAFSTDDEGVSHADYTSEWIYGWKRYGLSGDELKTLARQSLQHSFLKGEPLWADVAAGKVASPCAGVTPGCPDPPPVCQAFLEGSAKARTQWEYEARLADYLSGVGKRFPKLLGNSTPTPLGGHRP